MTETYKEGLSGKSLKFDTSKAELLYQEFNDFKEGKNNWVSLVTKEQKTVLGVTTGYTYTKDSKEYIEFISSYPFDEAMSYVLQNSPAIIIEELSLTNTSPEQAQALIDKILKNHKGIYENLLVSAGMLAKLRAKGLQQPEKEFQCQVLYNRLISRNNKLNRSMFLENENPKRGIEPVLSKLYGSDLDWIILNGHKGISGTPKIGALPVIAIYIIIAVAVTTVFAYLIYLAFKNTYSNSETDLKASDELMLALKSVDEPTKQAILQDLESQVDEAYSKGVMTAKSESFTGSLKNIALLMAGGFGLFWISKNINPTDAKRLKRG